MYSIIWFKFLNTVLLPIASKGRGAKGRVDVFYVFLLTVCKDFAEDLILCEGVTWVILCRMEWGNFKCCGRPLGSSDDMRQDVWMLVFKQTSLCQTKKWTKWTNTAYFPGIAAYKVFVSFRVFRCLNRKFRDFCDFCVTFRYSFALCFCSYSWYKIPEIIAELTKFTLYSHFNQPILAQMVFKCK